MPDPLLTLLATIERLDREATRGAWRIVREDEDAGDITYGIVSVQNEGPTVAWVPEDCNDNAARDARFIAFSRNTLAPLASMLRVAVDALTDIEDSGDRGFDQECARAALATIRRMAEEVA